MDDLLPEYERELAVLRQSLGEFAERYPKAAARLAISGQSSQDPHVERLIQSAALLNARAAARLDDACPELPAAMLEILYPEYLRPFPSCSIARFQGTAAIAKLTQPLTIERGTQLKTRASEYLFRTVYDVVLAPLRIARARYAPATAAPENVRLCEDCTAIVSITFAALAGGTALDSKTPKRARVFVDGTRRMVAATIDTLLLRAPNAFVEADESGTWIALDAVPLSGCGYSYGESLIERRDASQSQFRVLLEYFAFPEKFDFLDFDLAALMRAAGRCNSVTLHLPIKDLSTDSATAQCLRHLDATNFKLSCTPVINLFDCASEPVPVEKMDFPIFPVVPGTLNAASAHVYGIEAVRLLEARPEGAIARNVEPYHSLFHHTAQGGPIAFWEAQRDGRLAELLPGHDMVLSLVDSSGQLTKATGKQIEIDLTCTNGNLPSRMRIGNRSGDLLHTNESMAGRVSMLRAPTQSAMRPNALRHLWDIVGMMSAHALSLSPAGLPAFKKLMAAHVCTHSSIAMRHIDSTMHLARESALEWMPMEPQPMLMRGVRVRLAVDDNQLGDCAIASFARVFETILRHFVPANGFVQLMVISGQSGAQLVEGRPLPGALRVV
jgi:type VI secretion system protein ImpG